MPTDRSLLQSCHGGWLIVILHHSLQPKPKPIKAKCDHITDASIETIKSLTSMHIDESRAHKFSQPSKQRRLLKLVKKHCMSKVEREKHRKSTQQLWTHLSFVAPTTRQNDHLLLPQKETSAPRQWFQQQQASCVGRKRGHRLHCIIISIYICSMCNQQCVGGSLVFSLSILVHRRWCVMGHRLEEDAGEQTIWESGQVCRKGEVRFVWYWLIRHLLSLSYWSLSHCTFEQSQQNSVSTSRIGILCIDQDSTAQSQGWVRHITSLLLYCYCISL